MMVTALHHWLFFLCFLAAGLSAALSIYHSSVRRSPRIAVRDGKQPDRPPRISILRPVRNLDDGFEINMESLYRLDYPNYEILYAVDSLHDPIVPLLEAISRKYPHISTQILATGNPLSENPKVFKLACMAGRATGDLYWICDSNIRGERRTLSLLVRDYLESGAKIIFSPIRAMGGDSLGSMLENAYINTFVSGNVITAWSLFREPIIVGKSMLIERKTLERFGGFSYFRDYLAEDYMMGKIYRQCRIPLSTNFTWVHNINRTTSVSGFLSRMSRWAKLRYHINRPVYVLELLANPVMAMAPFAAWAPAPTGLRMLALTILIKLLLELAVFFKVNTMDRKRLKVILSAPFCILLKDVLLLYVYLAPFFSRTVTWRGGRISIGKDTLIVHPGDFPALEGA